MDLKVTCLGSETKAHNIISVVQEDTTSEYTLTISCNRSTLSLKEPIFSVTE